MVTASVLSVYLAVITEQVKTKFEIAYSHH